MAEAVADYSRRSTDGEPMSDDHARLWSHVKGELRDMRDDLRGSLREAVQDVRGEMRDGFSRLHDRIDGLSDDVTAVRERVAGLEATKPPEKDDKTGVATVAMRAIDATERRPILAVMWVLLGVVAVVGALLYVGYQTA